MSDLSQLMPGTEGINFYNADPDLAFLLRRYLSEDDYERAEKLLMNMGAVASQRMDALACQALPATPYSSSFRWLGSR